MPQSTWTHRAAVRTQDRVSFQAHLGFQDPASICQCPAYSASPLPSLPFSLIPSNVPVCSQEQWSCCQFKEPQLQRKGCVPPAQSLLLLANCRSSAWAGEKGLHVWSPAHITMGLIKVFCAALSTICLHCLLWKTWQGNACCFSS